jgi:hypothetical protein
MRVKRNSLQFFLDSMMTSSSIESIPFVMLVNSPRPQGYLLSFHCSAPFGLASVSTVGLSSYLILVGLYYSAISVSDDAKLRRTIREAALRESKFLDSIGKAYMGQEIESKVLGVAKELKETLAKRPVSQHHSRILR